MKLALTQSEERQQDQDDHDHANDPKYVVHEIIPSTEASTFEDKMVPRKRDTKRKFASWFVNFPKGTNHDLNDFTLRRRLGLGTYAPGYG